MAGYIFRGEDYSWAKLEFKINGVDVFHLTEIKIEVKQEKGLNYGAGVYPISRGKGKKEYMVSVKLGWQEVAALQEAAPYKQLEELPAFDLIVTAVGVNLIPIRIVCKDCEFKGNKLENKQGDMVIESDYELSCPFVDFGGGIPAI